MVRVKRGAILTPLTGRRWSMVKPTPIVRDYATLSVSFTIASRQKRGSSDKKGLTPLPGKDSTLF